MRPTLMWLAIPPRYSLYTVSGTYPSTVKPTAYNMRDGIYSVGWGSSSAAASWITLTTSAPVTVTAVKAAALTAGGWGTAYFNGALLQYMDNGNWVTGATISGAVNNQTLTIPLAVTASTFRLYLASNWLGVSEFYLV